MGSSEEGNIVLDLIGGQARSILETTKGRDSRKDRISLQLSAKLISILKPPTLPEYHRRQEAGCTKDLGAVPQWESGRRDDRGRKLRQQGRRQRRDTSWLQDEILNCFLYDQSFYLNGNGFDIRAGSQLFSRDLLPQCVRRASHRDIFCLLTT
jgi:hypothetical protein